MEISRRGLFNDMVVDWFILKNNQITLSLCFTFILKTGVGLPETGGYFLLSSFYNPGTTLSNE